MREMHQSTAVCGDLCLDGVALDADEFGVLAAVDAEGVAKGHASGEDKEAEAPEDGDAADFLPGNLPGLFSTGGAGGSTATVIVS